MSMTSLGELMIDVQRLAVLREVARAGSFAGAAAALHHTPSAVSQQVAALERSVGIVLVDRSTRGVRLTEAGRLLVTTAESVHAELTVAERQLRELRDEGPPTLTVVTFPSAGEPLLAPALTPLTAGRHVAITVVEAEPDGALAAIREGTADLALLYHFHLPEPPRGWAAAAGPGTYTPLLREPFRLVVPATHPLADRPRIDLADFADDRWIHGWGGPAEVVDALAALAGFRPQVVCRSSDYRFMSALVGAGVGVTLLPALALPERDDVRVLHLDPPPTRFVGAWVPDRPWRNPTVERLLTTLRRRAEQLADDPRAAGAHRERRAEEEPWTH
jgi:DNA-binding transcriptional LysR family regulator